MNYFSIALLLFTAAYAIHIGLIPSISDSYRTIDKRVYHLFFGLSTFLIALQGATTDERFVIPYVMVAFFFWSISMAAAFYADFLEGMIHSVCTYLAIAGGLALTVARIWPEYGLHSLWLVAVGIGGAVLIKWLVKKNPTLWAEYWAYALIFVPTL